MQVLPMTICHHRLSEFEIFYGEIEKQKKLIPISGVEGRILLWELNNPQSINWPLKNPENNEYFIPKLKFKLVQLAEGNNQTSTYFDKVAQNAAYQENYGRIKEVLTPYLDLIKQHCSEHTYRRIVGLSLVNLAIPD